MLRRPLSLGQAARAALALLELLPQAFTKRASIGVWLSPTDRWLIVDTGSATRVTLERNPYFWQVDPAGQQLPYLDRVQFQIISEVETIVLATINMFGGFAVTRRMLEMFRK